MARPKRSPKPKVKIKDLLAYIEALAPDDPVRKRLTPDKLIRIKKYVDELLYLDHVILGLKEDIDKNGEIEIYTNGKQQTRRTNPALTTYIDTVKAYNQLLRQVSEILRGAELDLEKNW